MNIKIIACYTNTKSDDISTSTIETKILRGIERSGKVGTLDSFLQRNANTLPPQHFKCEIFICYYKIISIKE